jgi:hypothetical protein
MNYEFTDDFEIECLGECDEWVYDIEVKECHNFFGNNILVHNSVFFSFDFVVKKLTEKDPAKIVDYLNKFSLKFIEPKIENIYEELAEYMNAPKNMMFMKREKIIERFLITGKKHYAYLLWDNEGVRYKEPQLKVTGIEIVRSSTPKIIKPYLKESIIVLMKNPENIHEYIQEVKAKFQEMSIEDVSFPRSVSNVKQYSDKATMYKKKCPIAVRAAIMHNAYIEKHKIDMYPINDGEKIKFFYATVPNAFFNSNVFGYIKKIPNKEIIAKYFDVSTQFDKVYFSVIKSIAEKAGYPIELKRQTNLEDLF